MPTPARRPKTAQVRKDAAAPAGRRPRSKAAAPEPRTSGEAVKRATGRPREDWFTRLDAWGATAREHREIVAWLTGEQGVDHWWAQTLTVDYEQARGLRPAGGSRDGTFSVNATGTIDVPVDRLYTTVMDAKRRTQWLPGATMRLRTAQPARTAHFDWEDGVTRVHVFFTAKGDARSQLAVSHERLPDAKAAETMKAFWRARITALKQLLEEPRERAR